MLGVVAPRLPVTALVPHPMPIEPQALSLCSGLEWESFYNRKLSGRKGPDWQLGCQWNNSSNPFRPWLPAILAPLITKAPDWV